MQCCPDQKLQEFLAGVKIGDYRSAFPVLSSRLLLRFIFYRLFSLSIQTNELTAPKRASLGYVYMALSATGVIFLPTTAKFALQSGSDVLSVALARGLVATFILLAVVLLMRLDLRLPRRLLLPSIVVGIAAALFVYGMYRAILTINISLALLILFLYPLVIAIWGHFRGTTRLRPVQWILGFVAGAGLLMILGLKFGQVSYVGVLMALMAMLATVVITLVNHHIVASTGSLVANFYMSLWTLLLFAVAILLLGQFQPPQTALGWSGMFGNGIAYCLSWVAFFAGASILGATRASMITLFEPGLAAVFAWIIFGETFTPLQWLGFAVVLTSLYAFEKQALQKS